MTSKPVRTVCVTGLAPVAVDDNGGRFEALDGTAVIIRRADDPTLPVAIGPALSRIRETVYGVAGLADLDAIEDELARDRQVIRDANGVLHSVDDMGFAIAFQVTVRKAYSALDDLTNAAGNAPQRPLNQPGITLDMSAVPRTLSHVVYFVPDAARAEAFYAERLGFRTTDTFIGAGPFMRPAGSDDHHCLFMIQTPPHMKGCEHFTFHMGSGTEVLLAGTRSSKKAGPVFGARGAISLIPTGSGTSTVHWLPLSNTTPTWTSTMTPGKRAARRCRRITRNCSCSVRKKNGQPAAHLRNGVGVRCQP